MKQVTLNIPENKFNFIIDLLKKFDFVKVVKQADLEKDAPQPADKEHDQWADLAMQGLAKAYSDDEPDYSDLTLKEPNPEYKPWKPGQ